MCFSNAMLTYKGLDIVILQRWFRRKTLEEGDRILYKCNGDSEPYLDLCKEMFHCK